MPFAVFLRAANVGTHQRFLPSEFVRRKDLAAFDLVNLGAVGTFVARSAPSEARLRSAIAAALPFETEIVVCPGAEVQTLARGDPFGVLPTGEKGCVSVLAGTPTRKPHLPVHVPDPERWEARLVARHGRFVLSVYRRLSGRLTYPNPVVEREFGVDATTRGWSTFLALAKLLDSA